MVSIRTRLTLWLTTLVIISTLIGLAFIESMLRQAFHDSIISRLHEDLEQIIIATHFENGRAVVDTTQLSNFYKPAYSGRYYQLNFLGEELRSPSLSDDKLAVNLLAPDDTRAWQAVGPLGHDIQLLSYGVNSSNSYQYATITVAQDLSIGRHVFSEVYGTKLTVNLVMLIVMIFGIFVTLSQSFKPVSQIKHALAKLRQGEIDTLSLDNIPSEIQPLAKTYNELLDYTSNQIQRSRNHLGNLSHGLKTPLTVMRQQVEVLSLSDPDSAKIFEQQLTLIHRMIERKLAAARSAGDQLPAAQLVLPRDIDSLCGILAKVYRDKSLQMRFDISPDITRLPIHREDGMELLGNLLDNSHKWAKSQVLLRVWQQKGVYHASVEDDGAGVDEIDLDKLTNRGTRLDEDVQGHGLGLSIVKEIAEQYQIKLTFSQSPALKGLKVGLVFKS